jgi:hypothetical protein
MGVRAELGGNVQMSPPLTVEGLDAKREKRSFIEVGEAAND